MSEAKHKDISPEMQKLLDETPVLSEQDVKELGEAVTSLDNTIVTDGAERMT